MPIVLAGKRLKTLPRIKTLGYNLQPLRGKIRHATDERELIRSVFVVSLPLYFLRLAGRSCELSLERFGSFLELIWGYVFHMSGDAPGIAEWVLDCCVAIAVERVLRCSDRFRTGLKGARIRGVDVINVDIQRIAFGRPLRLRIGNHQRGIADAQLGVHDLSAGSVHLEAILGVEDLFDEIDEFLGALDTKAWRN